MVYKGTHVGPIVKKKVMVYKGPIVAIQKGTNDAPPRYEAEAAAAVGVKKKEQSVVELVMAHIDPMGV